LNFLLHRHVALAATGHDLAATGAMLPDLWRMAHRRLHAPWRRLIGLPAGEDEARVVAGLWHHRATDAWFHEHPAFLGGESAVKAAILEAGVTAPRLSLLAHPIWELCLDGALVRREGAGALRRLLERGFAAAQKPTAAIEARLGLPAGEPIALRARMERLERALATDPWIDAYQSGPGVAYCIDRVRRGVGLGAMNADDLARLGAVLGSLERRADESLGELLAAAAERPAGDATPGVHP
jgi:hypothetical protein